MPYIHLSIHDRRLATFEVGRELAIGRTPDNDVVIDNPGVSAAHARIFREGDAFFVEDRGSKNGTYLRGRRLGRQRLDYGDVVSILKHQLHFVSVATKGVTPPPRRQGDGGLATGAGATLAIDISRHAELMRAIEGRPFRAELRVVSEGGRARCHPLTGPTHTIGRGARCLVRTHGWLAPPLSARLVRQAEGYLLIPERRGEVVVNGVAIEGPCRLAHGDHIGVRGVEMRYRAEALDGV